jgi:carnitine O-acetyltransferase
MAKTFEFQKDLKRLPIPSLTHTKELYLQSCKPFFETAQEAKEYSDIVSDFFTSGGLAENLQSRLIAYDKTQKNSWLEAWWLKYAYLSWRNSLLVHSNWFVLTQNLPNLKRFVPFNEEFSGIQIARAAGFANCFLDYKDLIDRQELEPEKTKTGYLDMSQYTRLFGVTRVPKPECDVLVGLHPCKSQHIIVLVKNQIFVVYVYDQKTGARISDKEMERQFQECINRTLSGKRMQPPVCILSGQHRDKWAEHHGILLQVYFYFTKY